MHSPTPGQLLIYYYINFKYLNSQSHGSNIEAFRHVVLSKLDILPSEGHFGIKTIMAAILKGRSKPKYSKLATSKGPS